MARPEKKRGRFSPEPTKPRQEVQALMQAYGWLCENRKEHRTIMFYIDRVNKLKIKMSREGDLEEILKRGL